MKTRGGFVCTIVLCECKTCSNQRLCFFAQLRCLSMCSPSKHVFMFVCVHGTICFGESEIALLLFQSFWVTKRVTHPTKTHSKRRHLTTGSFCTGPVPRLFFFSERSRFLEKSNCEASRRSKSACLRKRSCACLFQEDFARRKCIDSIRGERTEMHSFRVVAETFVC